MWTRGENVTIVEVSIILQDIVEVGKLWDKEEGLNIGTTIVTETI